MKKTLQQYAELDAEIKALEAKKLSLKLKILNAMEKDEMEKEVTAFGTFTRARRMKYTYSEAVQKLTERLKIAKIKEEQKGVAKGQETEYLVYTPKK